VHTVAETLNFYDEAIRIVAAKGGDPESQEIFDLADLRTRVLVAVEREKIKNPDRVDDLRLVIGACVAIGYEDEDGETIAESLIVRCPCCGTPQEVEYARAIVARACSENAE
jgi:hypothetical protein